MTLKLFLDYGSTLEVVISNMAEGLAKVKQYKAEGLSVKSYEIKRR